MRSSTKVLRGVRRPPWRNGFQPSSKLSTTNGWWAELWWKRVPEGWVYNMETPSAELCSCRRDEHVVAFCRTKICPTRNAGDWDADVEVGRTVLTDSHVVATAPFRWLQRGHGTVCHQRLGPAPHFWHSEGRPSLTFFVSPVHSDGQQTSALSCATV